MKENITEYENGINKIKSLRAVEYEWIDSQKKTEIGKIVGFIAQECSIVVPKMVNKFDLNGVEMLGISQTELIPFLWSGCRNMINRIEKLETDNDILKMQITEIIERLDNL